MRFALFYQSIISDWNNGNAHFLRGVVTELLSRGDEVIVFEPENSWSRQHLLHQEGRRPIEIFRKLFNTITVHPYREDFTDLAAALDGVDAVIVHEWNSTELVRWVVRRHKENRAFVLLFHDTHHRIFSNPTLIREYDLPSFDGILAFGESLKKYYQRQGLTAWTWHEAADTRIFYPRRADRQRRDLLWIGNGGDGERDREYEEFLLSPVREFGLRATFYGVRYTPAALNAFLKAGFQYGGWLANYQVPAAFGSHRLTLHIPRGPYVRMLKGIPTIRVFEALACGIPLICTYWEDTERLFTPDKDFLIARDGRSIKRHIGDLLHDPYMALALSTHGRRTILSRHTCGHRVDELLNILSAYGVAGSLDASNQSPPKKARKA